jgi:hypothetical protein
MRVFIAAIIASLAIALPRAAERDEIQPPAVPAGLEAPADQKVFLIRHAVGAQNYVCLPSATGFAWTLYGPQATLFDDETEQSMTHFLSPNPIEGGTPRATWQHSRDTSRVWAVAVQPSSDPNYVAPGAIPWLKLNVVGAQYGPDGGSKLTVTKTIQRINTAGGIAPAGGCSVATDVGKKALVPYEADYVFYKLREM